MAHQRGMMITRLATTLAQCLALGLALCLAALPALAQNSIGTPLTAEILPGWRMADGRHVAAVKLTMAPGWKTYWRSPGDAGIPPTFDWKRSNNLRDVAITWPAPKVFDQSGARSIGYAHQVVLPLTITPKRNGKPILLDTTIELGVCSDICVPQTLRLKATLDTEVSTPTPAIAAALAARPFTAAEAGVKSATCSIRPNDQGLGIEARLTLPSSGGAETVVIEPGRPNLWMSEMQSTRSGQTLTATGVLIANSGGAFALDRSALRITVIGSNHSVDISGCSPG
tara:strand:- start:118464 stop:119315 length:852 start_codon:yes stop_codon:yes gene_type:complete